VIEVRSVVSSTSL